MASKGLTNTEIQQLPLDDLIRYYVGSPAITQLESRLLSELELDRCDAEYEELESQFEEAKGDRDDAQTDASNARAEVESLIETLQEIKNLHTKPKSGMEACKVLLKLEEILRTAG